MSGQVLLDMTRKMIGKMELVMHYSPGALFKQRRRIMSTFVDEFSHKVAPIGNEFSQRLDAGKFGR
jgi:hypothetical protein